LSANFKPSLTFLQTHGNIISIVSLIILLTLPTLFSIAPSVSNNVGRLFILTNKLPNLKEEIDQSTIIQIDGAIIAGTLILLTLTTATSGGINRSQITFITADIIFPFAISAIVALFNISQNSRFKQFEKRLMIAGFVNLMISIMLMAVMGY
jgi:hypothetical protein